jgi:tetrahydromethanopterin S-methyltransferase subunit E
MLTLNIEKHVIYFDDKNTAYSSFSFGCGKKAANKEDAEKKEEEQVSSNMDMSEFHF